VGPGRAREAIRMESASLGCGDEVNTGKIKLHFSPRS
jgi:hypothetical protein